MPDEIIFATSNSGKVATLRGHLAVHDLPIIIIQQPLDLVEPQANTAAEIASVKAIQAYEQLQKPVLVDDSSFHIFALGRFPGPYIKYVLETVGIKGIMTFMQGHSDRRAFFKSSLVFVDERGEKHVFDGTDAVGEIVENIDNNDHAQAWSELWKIFAPAGFDGRTYSQISSEEMKTHRAAQNDNSAYARFAEWLKRGTHAANS